MAKYSIPIGNVIRHYDVTGKCAQNLLLETKCNGWLLKKLSEQKEESVEMIYNYIDENMPDWAKPTVQKLD